MLLANALPTRPLSRAGGRVTRQAAPGPVCRSRQPRCHPRHRPVLCDASQQQATTSAAASSPPVHEGKFEVTLKGIEALQTVKLDLAPDGKGQAVVVVEVAEGSLAEELGVRPGQKLNALSDPMRYGTMWSLLDRPSLRFVVDTFKMRRASPIDLEFEPMLGPAEMEVIFGGTDATTATVEGQPEGAAASASASGSPAGTDIESSLDSLLGSSSESESTGPTIGERLAAKYEASQKSQMAVNQVQARIDRRKAYMEIDDQRDDTPLLLGLAAAFLLPPLVILIVAYFTGYLDRLYLTALTLSG